MSIVLDAILAVMVIVFIVIFTKGGFAGTIINIGKGWKSMFFSAVLGPYVSNLLNRAVFMRPITNGIYNTLNDIVNSNPNGYSLGEMFRKLPDGFRGLLEHFDISLVELEAEYGSATFASNEILHAVAAKIAAPASKIVSEMLSYIIMFIVAFIFLMWLENMKKKRGESKFFCVVDGIVGFFVGTAIGLCAMYGVVTVMYTVFQVIIVFDVNSPVTEIYNKTYIFKYVNELDVKGLFDYLIGMIFKK